MRKLSKLNLSYLNKGPFIFYLLLLFIPIQLGKHFWFDFSYVTGIKIDYLSPTLYLSDLLIMAILIPWLLNKGSALLDGLKGNFFLCFFLSSAILSSVLSSNQGGAFLGWVRIAEFSLLALYLKDNFSLLSLRKALIFLSTGALIAGLIAWGQSFKEGSLGLWVLGERFFNSSTPGIAQALVNGELLLRPYSTFPHPNVLAGYLSLVATVAYFVASRLKKSKLYLLTLFFLGTILLSFSRTGALSSALGLTGVFLIYQMGNQKKRIFLTTLAALIFLTYFSSFSFFSRFQEDSVEKRIELNQIAVEMIKDKPLLGMGPNNFIVSLQNYTNEPKEVRFLQPVHNIFLLIASETGILGLGAFLGLLLTIVKRLIYSKRYLLLLMLSQVMLISMFDHYFWTLQQGQIILWILIGISLTPTGVPEEILDPQPQV